MSIGKILYVVSCYEEKKIRLVIVYVFAKVDSSQTEHFRNLLTISKAMHMDQVQNW